MKIEHNLQNDQLSEKEIEDLMFSKKFRTQNLLLMTIYVVLIVLSLFII
ncbi:MAG: hypothetical protein WAR79_03010 [Melioribacteraceae bacterium]